MAAKTYRKLPGTGGGLASRRKLYLADDHLLCVDQTGFTERYARFELNDIQAITARETGTWIVYLSCWGGLLLLCILLALFFPLPGGRDFFFVMSIVLGVVVLYNLLRGRTCQAILYTAVSTQQLSSLSRWSRFYKVSNLLAPLIETRQGRFDPVAFHETAQPEARSVSAAAVAPAGAAVPTVESETESHPERAVFWLSLAVFADAAAAGLLFLVDRPAVAVLRLAAILAITCLMVIGFATVPRKPTTDGLRRVLWANFGYVIFSYGFLYVAFIMGSMDSVLPSTIAFDAVLPSHSPVSLGFNIASIVICLIVGTMGLLAVAGARARN